MIGNGMPMSHSNAPRNMVNLQLVFQVVFGETTN